MAKQKGVGRPRIIESVEEAEKVIEKYFKSLGTDDIPTVEELTLELGLSSRQSLKEYADREEYSDTIKRAKLRILLIHKKLALKGKINPTIFIFNSKNNFGYSDKTELELSGNKEKPVLVSIAEIMGTNETSS